MDVATGALFQDFNDYTLSGRHPLPFDRHYSTAHLDDEQGALFGRGWRSPFEWRIRRDIDGYRVEGAADGSSIFFDTDRSELLSGRRKTNFGAFADLMLLDGELCVTQWNPDDARITRHFFPDVGSTDWGWISRRDDGTDSGISFRYTSSGVLRSIVQTRERRGFELSRDDEGRVVEVYRRHFSASGGHVDERSPYLRYEYDSAGYLSTFINPCGSRSSYTYDSQGRMVSERTLSGKDWRFSYDSHGRCVVTTARNRFDYHALDYDVAERVTRVSDANGAVTTYVHNRAGQVERSFSPLGVERATRFDDHGRITTEILPGGRTLAYEYDAAGNRCMVTGADGAVSRYSFDENHRAVRFTDPLGANWTRCFDGQGRLLGKRDPLGAEERFAYNESGDLISQRDATGNATELRWSEDGELVGFTDRDGSTSSYSWDGFGHVISFTDAAGHCTRMRRDILGRILSVAFADGGERRYGWDVFDNLTSYTDESGTITSWSYCDCGNLEQETKPGGVRLNYGWNAIPGQLATITNEKGEVFHFSYDKDGQLREELDFAGRSISYHYDENGFVASVRKSSGKCVKYERDACGRIVEVAHEDGTAVRYGYDLCGRLVTADNGTCPVSFDFDAVGRVIHEIQGVHELWHEYDPLGRRIKRRSGLRETTSFGWTPSGRVSTIKPDGYDPVRFSYDSRGCERIRELGHAMTLTSEMDSRGRLVCRESCSGNSQYGDHLYRRFAYDAVGNLLETFDSARGATHWAHDQRQRLTRVVHPDGEVERFRYDQTDLIVSYMRGATHDETTGDSSGTSYERGSGDRLVRRGDTLYEYDLDGQLVRRSDGDGVTTYHWNDSGFLSGLITPDGRCWTYRYDALGRRVSKSGPGTEKEFWWDGDTIMHEIERNDGEIGRVETWEINPHDFSPVSMRCAGEVYFCINDQIGTPTELIDSSARICWSREACAYGSTRRVEERRSKCSIRFQGQWYDEESGLCYNRFRYYSPEAASFISPDPLGLRGAYSPYVYTSDPTRFVDPLGLSNTTCDTEVLRAVTPEQAEAIRAGRGIERPKPAHRTTPTQHVAGTPHSRDPWTSTTRSPESAEFFATHGGTQPANPVVAIDMNKIDPANILDVSTPERAAAHLTTPFTRNAAASHQEVLIRGDIPHEAIRFL